MTKDWTITAIFHFPENVEEHFKKHTHRHFFVKGMEKPVTSQLQGVTIKILAGELGFIFVSFPKIFAVLEKHCKKILLKFLKEKLHENTKFDEEKISFEIKINNNDLEGKLFEVKYKNTLLCNISFGIKDVTEY